MPAHRDFPSDLPALARWPEPPQWLTPAEATHWTRLGSRLLKAATVRECDLVLVELLCRVLAAIDVTLEGAHTKDTAGRLSTLTARAQALLESLGGTPASRSKVKPLARRGRKKKADPLDNW